MLVTNQRKYCFYSMYSGVSKENFLQKRQFNETTTSTDTAPKTTFFSSVSKTATGSTKSDFIPISSTYDPPTSSPINNPNSIDNTPGNIVYIISGILGAFCLLCLTVIIYKSRSRGRNIQSLSSLNQYTGYRASVIQQN